MFNSFFGIYPSFPFSLYSGLLETTWIYPWMSVLGVFPSPPPFSFTLFFLTFFFYLLTAGYHSQGIQKRLAGCLKNYISVVYIDTHIYTFICACYERHDVLF
ncbi:hypothetical protein BJX61DRAFT_30144 [Aspergillus egyptiacus]|nr:hypothetical protein BJX61DRAFT_30144 [Aspergillus egyptiacus]